MKTKHLSIFLSVCIAIFANAQTPLVSDKQDVELTIPGGDTISIRVPNQWIYKVIQPILFHAEGKINYAESEVGYCYTIFTSILIYFSVNFGL